MNDKEFLEWLGFRFVDKPLTYNGIPGGVFQNHWIYPDGRAWGTPRIDLNFIEKYAFPEVHSLGFNIHIHSVVGIQPKVVLSNVLTTKLSGGDTIVEAFKSALGKLFEEGKCH